jgi:hypothetical protein
MELDVVDNTCYQLVLQFSVASQCSGTNNCSSGAPRQAGQDAQVNGGMSKHQEWAV